MRSLNFVTTACAGELISGSRDVLVNHVCSDSRQAQAKDVFVALRGDKHDGHRFVGEVAQRGVAAVIVERDKVPPALPHCGIIAVDDTRKALGRLAAKYRQDFHLPLIAVGGSNGKTTTKELIASVLKQKLSTLWSEASFNNDIGVPLTLLRLHSLHQAAILEVGTNHPGEIAPLVKMIEPKFGVITSIGREHLEFFGDVAGVAQEEGALAELLPADGKLFLNGDSEWTGQIARRSPAKVIRIGLSGKNDWTARDIQVSASGVRFNATAPQPQFSGEYEISLLGSHQAVNALFAIALGAEFGLSRDEIARGLAECKPAKMRMDFFEANGVYVLDDSYNANADSMVAALKTLSEIDCHGRRIAVLGDMAELGAQSEAAHAEIGRKAAELGLDRLFTVGKMARVTARAARNAGLDVEELADVESALEALKKFLRAGDVVLLKASRTMRLERMAEALKSVEPFNR